MSEVLPNPVMTTWILGGLCLLIGLAVAVARLKRSRP